MNDALTDQIVRLYEAGQSTRQVAAAVGRSQKFVHTRLRDAGVDMTGRPRGGWTPQGECTVGGCGERAQVRGLCRVHYNAWRRGADLAVAPRRWGG